MAREKDDRLFAMFAIEMDEHPKIIDISNDAFRALFEATFYARRMLTDGFLDERVVLRRWGRAVADELSSNDPDRPSWIRVERGWLIHDWEKHHPMRADIEARRADVSEKRRQAGRKGAANRWQADSKAMANDSPESETESDAYKEPKGSSSSEIAIAIRPEVSQLLDLLDSLLVKNEVKKLPKRNKANVDAMRRLIDVDGYRPEQVARIIMWSQQDGFWRANILSASKLREKFEQLRLKANEERERRINDAPTKSEVAHDFIASLEEIDATHGGGAVVGDHLELR